MAGRTLPTLLKERVKHILEDIGITLVVRVNQRASSDACQPEVIPLPVVTLQADLDVTEAAQPLCLGKQQHEKLLPAAEPFGVTVAIITFNALLKTVLTNELH